VFYIGVCKNTTIVVCNSRLWNNAGFRAILITWTPILRYTFSIGVHPAPSLQHGHRRFIIPSVPHHPIHTILFPPNYRFRHYLRRRSTIFPTWPPSLLYIFTRPLLSTTVQNRLVSHHFCHHATVISTRPASLLYLYTVAHLMLYLYTPTHTTLYLKHICHRTPPRTALPCTAQPRSATPGSSPPRSASQ